MRKIFLALLLILTSAFLFADTHTAATCSYANVNTAYTAASSGDTVIIPAGSATWDNQLVITKGIYIIGAGVGATTITSNYTPPSPYYLYSDSFLFTYDPTTPSLNEPFRLSGMTIDCANKCYGFMLKNTVVSPSITPITNIRVDHLEVLNPLDMRPYCIYGTVYGVVDNCQIHGGYGQSFGVDEGWRDLTFTPGSPNQFYFEDNIIYGTTDTMSHVCASGTRWCFRHNTFDGSALTNGVFPIFDAHGNAAWTGAMGVEIYENTINLGTYGAIFYDQRGNRSIVYNNTINTTSTVSMGIREEYNDNSSPYPTAPDGEPDHVSSSYYWSNLKNGTTRIDPTITQTVDYGGGIGLVPQLNRDAWIQGNSFDGSVGIGVGLLSARPSSGLTVGVGYWATDTNTLYRATGATTWETYYTPYTYPHPLRLGMGGDNTNGVLQPGTKIRVESGAKVIIKEQ
jgi:hypothetical protein